MSMPELTAILVAKHDSEYADHKFHAALQGVDLDKESNRGGEAVDFDSFKDKVLAKHTGHNSDDVISLRGQSAEQAGFGIGMGLEYEFSET